MIRIANANMSRAIRAVSTERGYSLAQFALFAYGGAGPLHAMEIAAECGIRRGRAAGAGHDVRSRHAAHGHLVRFRAQRDRRAHAGELESCVRPLRVHGNGKRARG